LPVPIQILVAAEDDIVAPPDLRVRDRRQKGVQPVHHLIRVCHLRCITSQVKHADERNGPDDGKASERKGKARLHFALSRPPRLFVRSRIDVVRSRIDGQSSPVPPDTLREVATAGMYLSRYNGNDSLLCCPAGTEVMLHGTIESFEAPEGSKSMASDDRTRIIHSRTPESAAMVANTRRAMAITAKLNRLTFDDADEVRALFSELIGKKVDDSFLLIPPFYTAHGNEIRVGRKVFVNQNCTFYDLGGLDIADEVLIGPNVSLITSGHPVEPENRRAVTIGKPIVIQRNVWIAAGATVIGGVTVGENSVVAAGSVVTRDVPPNTLVGGNPARIIRSIGDPS
jgi:acetyltransferase-like isoleucine patch superfamily enzyme